MSIIDNIQKRKIAENSKSIDSIIAQFVKIQDIELYPINKNAVYSLKDLKENEHILKIDDSKSVPVALLIDKKDLPLSKRLCFLSDLNVQSKFSYIYEIDINDHFEKDYKLVNITEYQKATFIANTIEQCMNSFENKEEEKLLRNLQLYARNCVTESILVETVKLLQICDKSNDVYVDTKNANFSLKLLKELQTDYNTLPIKKFISKYEKAHDEIKNKCVPAALEFLSKQIQNMNQHTVPLSETFQTKTENTAQVTIDDKPNEKAKSTEIDQAKSEEIFSKIKSHAEPKKDTVDTSEQSNEKTA